MMAHRGYQRVDSDPTISDNPNAALLDGSYQNQCGVYLDGHEDDDELERHEMEDCLGDIPSAFHRRSRREGFYDAETSRSDWEQHPLMHALEKSNEEGPSNGDDDLKDEEEVDEAKGLKKYAKLILPHVALVLLTCAYTVAGALVFYKFEQPHELETKMHQLFLIDRQQRDFVDRLISLAASNTTRRSLWEEVAEKHKNNMSDRLFTAFEKHFLTSNEVKQNTTEAIWSFSSAIFFAATVVTTIGYGNPVPASNGGRVACILFALFGIPLTLVTIADLGKFLSEHLIWLYGNYRKLKHYLCYRHRHKERREHVCKHCQSAGIGKGMEFIEEQKIPSMLVFVILVLYTALGGVLMSRLEPWDFFNAFYWSFITMTTVGFGDLMPRRDHYMYIILLYIILGLAITTMCIDLVGVQYIRKIHYLGRKVQDARSALAVVGGKVVLVSELYANLMQKRAKGGSKDAYIVDNLYISKHIIPFIPNDIRLIRYIDQPPELGRSPSTASSIMDNHSCRFCHSRFSMSNHHLYQQPTPTSATNHAMTNHH